MAPPRSNLETQQPSTPQQLAGTWDKTRALSATSVATANNGVTWGQAPALRTGTARFVYMGGSKHVCTCTYWGLSHSAGSLLI